MTNGQDWLREILKEGEAVRWSGSAQPYGLFDEAHKRTTAVFAICALIAGLALTGGYLWLCAARNVEPSYGVSVVCLGIALLILWRPLSNQKHIAAMRYVLTDGRLIAFSAKTKKKHSMPLPALDVARLARAGAGTCHALFGSPALKASRRKLTALAIRDAVAREDAEGDADSAGGMVFYNISADAGKALRVLLERPFAAGEGSSA